MDAQDRVQSKVKSRYSKPVLRSIDLLSKEVMGEGCKTISSGAEGVEDPVPCSTTGCQSSDGS